MSDFRYVYLHGFASSAFSVKGVALAERLRGTVELERAELNRPSFAKLSHAAMLAELDALYARDPRPFRVVGSSLGGWLAARFAELHPERVDRLVLLCPGFRLVERWPAIVGDEGWARWERDGELEIPDAEKRPVRVHYGFVEEARTQPAEPEVTQPTVIVHGVRDAIVPIAFSRAYASSHPNVRLVEVDDDHALGASIDRIEAEVRACFELG